jgi:hypothetical protein
MGISRVTKAVAELRQENTSQNAADIRRKAVDVFLPHDLSKDIGSMAIVAVAVILRTFTGQVRIHGEPDPSYGKSLKRRH